MRLRAPCEGVVQNGEFSAQSASRGAEGNDAGDRGLDTRDGIVAGGKEDFCERPDDREFERS
jgi:hypothetical protein